MGRSCEGPGDGAGHFLPLQRQEAAGQVQAACIGFPPVLRLSPSRGMSQAQLHLQRVIAFVHPKALHTCAICWGLQHNVLQHKAPRSRRCPPLCGCKATVRGTLKAHADGAVRGPHRAAEGSSSACMGHRFQTRGSEGLTAGAEWGLEEPLQQPVGNHTSRSAHRSAVEAVG